MEKEWDGIAKKAWRKASRRNRRLLPVEVITLCPVCGGERLFRMVGWDSLYSCAECNVVKKLRSTAEKQADECLAVRAQGSLGLFLICPL